MPRAGKEQLIESRSQIVQRRAQRACWALLQRVHASIDFSCVQVVEIRAADAGAHIALLARQFPGLHFELPHEATPCNDTIRMLWAPDGLTEADLADGQLSTYDIVVLTHQPDDVRETIKAFDGFARISAKRDDGHGRSVAIFGKGLARDVFRSQVRVAAA